MNVDKILQSPGIGCFQDVSLKDLEAKIKGVSRSEAFTTLMTWLNEQIKQDIITQDEVLLEGFVRLLHNHSHAEMGSLHLTQVNEALKGWLEKDAIENPAYRRRYLIMQKDINDLLAKERNFPKNWDASSSPSHQRKQREESSSAPSFKQEADDSEARKGVKLGNIDIALENLSLTPLPSPTGGNVIGLDSGKSGKSVHLMIPNQALLRQSNNTDLDGVITTRETITIDSSPDVNKVHIPTQGDPRVRKYGTRNDATDLPDLPPEKYICRRCRKPGHWMQLCPKFLDPYYDQKPERDYECRHCGRRGDHYAILCPRHPREDVLKRRNLAIADSRGSGEPRLSKGDSTRRYRGGESSNPSSQSHSESRRLQGRPPYRERTNLYSSRSRSRSRSPIFYRDRSTIPSPRNRIDEYRPWPQSNKESDVSPYTARSRLTRELRMSSDATRGRSPSYDDPYRFDNIRRNSAHRNLSPFVDKEQRPHRDLDKVIRTSNEGRLSFDDDIGTNLHENKPLPLPTTDAPRHARSIGRMSLNRSRSPFMDETRRRFIDKHYADKVTRTADEKRPMHDEVYENSASYQSLSYSPMIHVSRQSGRLSPVEVKGGLSSKMINPEDLDGAKNMTENFLDSLATEVLLEGRTFHGSTIMDSQDVAMEDVNDSIMCTGDGTYSDEAIEPDSPALSSTLNPEYQLVQCPPFSSQVAGLFRGREIPIYRKVNRKTASQMMTKSEDLDQPLPFRPRPTNFDASLNKDTTDIIK
ncbi:hypothetical protein GGS21DRAFT_319776 [Xylaria nigripes]|nr:hypothetical protein GGS21DRAFT_319776 [Xylaria nigripes]